MGQVQYNSEIVEYNDDWSFKNFVNQPVPSIPNGITIYSTSFYFEQPDSEPFPSDMTGVTFVKCNMDNLIIPNGNTLVDCSNVRFQAQDDGRDWIINDNDEPVEKI